MKIRLLNDDNYLHCPDLEWDEENKSQADTKKNFQTLSLYQGGGGIASKKRDLAKAEVETSAAAEKKKQKK